MNRFILSRRQGPGTKRPGRARPVLERLEDRTVLSNAYTAATVADLIADINAANTAGGSNTIALVAGNTFTLTALDNSTDGGNGLPVIAANDNLTIAGNGDTIARSTTVGTPAFRVLDVAAGASLALSNATLQGGGAGSSNGGAILNDGSMDLNGVTVQQNAAVYGGGIYSSGSLTLEGGTLISGNLARGRPGYGSTPGGDAKGGGLYAAGGAVTMTSTTVSSNTAQGGVGDVQHGRFRGGFGSGGGMYVAGGTVTLTNDTLTSNTAAQGASLKGGGYGAGGAVFVAGGTVKLTNCVLSKNHAAAPSPSFGRGRGGGMYIAGGTVTLRSDTVTGNSTYDGGGGGAGGLDILSSATVYLDAFTVKHTTGNTPDDIDGSYILIT